MRAVVLRWLAMLVLGLAAVAGSLPARAAAVSITYELVPLAGPGRYEYRYTLTNESLASPLSWFALDFDTALYEESTLQITSSGTGLWSEQILGSVLGNPAQYDAYKTVGAGLGIGESASGFAVAFTWLGTGTPGSQAFTVYDPGTLEVLALGRSTPGQTNGAPEPGTAALVLLALLGAGRRRRAQRRPSRP